MFIYLRKYSNVGQHDLAFILNKHRLLTSESKTQEQSNGTHGENPRTMDKKRVRNRTNGAPHSHALFIPLRFISILFINRTISANVLFPSSIVFDTFRIPHRQGYRRCCCSFCIPTNASHFLFRFVVSFTNRFRFIFRLLPVIDVAQSQTIGLLLL